MKQGRGFTLIELMVTVAVLGIILSIAVPSMSDYMDKRKVINAAEAVYGEFQYARSEAIARSQNVFVSFSTDGSSTWSMGVSTSANCDPTQTIITAADACVLVIDDGDGDVHGTDPEGDGTVVNDTNDLVLRVLTSANFPGIEMGNVVNEAAPIVPPDGPALVAVAFGAATQTSFDPTRGVLGGSAGSVELRFNGGDVIYDLRVVVGPIGRVRLCSPISQGGGVPGYSQCT